MSPTAGVEHAGQEPKEMAQAVLRRPGEGGCALGSRDGVQGRVGVLARLVRHVTQGQDGARNVPDLQHEEGFKGHSAAVWARGRQGWRARGRRLAQDRVRRVRWGLLVDDEPLGAVLALSQTSHIWTPSVPVVVGWVGGAWWGHAAAVQGAPRGARRGAGLPHLRVGGVCEDAHVCASRLE